MMHYMVIIPCYNEENNLPRCLESIEYARGERDVVIRLADNQSTDKSCQIAKSFGAQVLRSETRLSIAALRNLGARFSPSQVLVFLDADMEVPPNWFEHLDKAFEKDGVDAVGFVEDVPDTAPWYAAAWSKRTAARRNKPRPADFLPGRNIAVKREYFENVGGFSDSLLTSEDKDFVLRLKKAGAKVYSYPPIYLFHWGFERTAYELARKEFWRQGSHIAMLRRHGLSLRLIRFPLLALLHVLAWFLLPLALGLGLFWLAVPWFIAWLPSIIIVLAKPATRRRPKLAVQLLLLYHLRFVIAGVSVIYEFVSGRGAVDYVAS